MTNLLLARNYNPTKRFVIVTVTGATVSKATLNEGVSSLCFHCGEECTGNAIHAYEKDFCCEGCKTVYEILSENGFSEYYKLGSAPGAQMRRQKAQSAFSYLDHSDVITKLIDFQDSKITRIRFNIPQIHCASCIWLLENLYKLNPGIVNTKVNFLRKEVSISYCHDQLTLRKVVELLASIGYEPAINLQSLEGRVEMKTSRQFYYQLGIAGFCFGNIMLLSFPEYLSLNRQIDASFTRFFSYLNLFLALPVFFYCSSYYFKAAITGLKARMLDINVPVALGIFVLFSRSAYEIITHTGSGYLDSLAGLVFFLLIGRWFQNKTYDSLSFERSYKSYFPIAATRMQDGREESIPLNEIETADVLLIRNGELIPADAVLLKGNGQIDYSFVTGESNSIKADAGAKIFAGGRQVGGAIEVKVLKKTSQSYLTLLWNQDIFLKERGPQLSSFINRFSSYFTPIALLVATAAGAYWFIVDSLLAMNVFTSVLIVVCACALALATPFTLGSAMRILGKNNFYLKDTSVIENIASAGVIVFDKTGTLTNAQHQKARFEGELTEYEQQLAKSLVYHSSHPLSRQIFDSLPKMDLLPIESFRETGGRGVAGMHQGISIVLGSESFVKGMHVVKQNDVTVTRSWLSMNGEVKGYFHFNNHYRDGLAEVVHELGTHYKTALISGDGPGEKAFLKSYFAEEDLHFNQNPEDKLSFISLLEKHGKKVVMIGDGLNDAGALKQSSVGISITENVNNFTPSCDAILHANTFRQMPALFRFAKGSMRLLKVALAISLLYNVFALSFAVQGMFTPVVAAILMPLSSITVTAFGIISTTLLARRNNLKT